MKPSTVIMVGLLCGLWKFTDVDAKRTYPAPLEQMAIRKGSNSGFIGKVFNGTFSDMKVVVFIGINTTTTPTQRFAKPVMAEFPDEDIFAYEDHSVPLEQQPTGGLTPLVKSRTKLASGSGFSEQAITMTVARPYSLTKDLPAKVLFHGGADSIGGGDMIDPIAEVESPMFTVDPNDPDPHKNKKAFVAFNYRLGKYGWLQIPGATNLGLLDQINHLCYLHQNARAFGIDRDEVTLFGYSAGAGNILTLMSIKDSIRCPWDPDSPVTLWKNVVLLDPYFGLLAPTPSAVVPGRTLPQSYAIADALGCLLSTDSAILDCLKPIANSIMDFVQFPDYWAGLTYYAFAEWWCLPSKDGELIKEEPSITLRNYKPPKDGSVTMILTPFQGTGLCTSGTMYTGSTAATIWSTRAQYRLSCEWWGRYYTPEQREAICKCGGDRSFTEIAADGCYPAFGTVEENPSGEPNFINATFAMCTSLPILSPALKAADILVQYTKTPVYLIATTIQSTISASCGVYNQCPPHAQWPMYVNTTGYYEKGSHNGPWTGPEAGGASIAIGFSNHVMRNGAPIDPSLIKSNFTDKGQPRRYRGNVHDIAQFGSSTEPRSWHAVGGYYNAPGCDSYASTPIGSNLGWHPCLVSDMDPKLIPAFALSQAINTYLV